MSALGRILDGIDILIVDAIFEFSWSIFKNFRSSSLILGMSSFLTSSGGWTGSSSLSGSGSGRRIVSRSESDDSDSSGSGSDWTLEVAWKLLIQLEWKNKHAARRHRRSFHQIRQLSFLKQAQQLSQNRFRCHDSLQSAQTREKALFLKKNSKQTTKDKHRNLQDFPDPQQLCQFPIPTCPYPHLVRQENHFAFCHYFLHWKNTCKFRMSKYNCEKQQLVKCWLTCHPHSCCRCSICLAWHKSSFPWSVMLSVAGACFYPDSEK